MIVFAIATDYVWRGRMTCQIYPRYTLAGSYDHAKLTLAGGYVWTVTPAAIYKEIDL